MSDPIQTASSALDDLAAKPHTTPTPAPAEASDTAKNAQPDIKSQSLDLKTLADHTLHFLATASNETLGVCLAGLGVGTYFVLGRVGLVLMGVVGGVVLHATWESRSQSGNQNGTQDQGARRREVGADIAHRVLDWRNARGQVKEKDGDSDNDNSLDVKLYSGKELDFSDFKPETAAALTELTDAVIRDYVKWWYSPIIPTEDQFPGSCRQILIAFLVAVSNHLSRKRPADNFVDFVTRSSSFMVILFEEIAAAIAASPGDYPTEAVDIYLKMKRDSTLANILDTEYQMKQFSNAAEDILQNYLESKTYNCMPAQVFLKQILAKVVLEMIVVSCSKPEWINGWIVHLLEDGEPQLMNAIDAGVDGSSEQSPNSKEHIQDVDQVSDTSGSLEKSNHKRVVSQAQDAMDEAMREAQRLSQLIAEEDAKRLKEQPNASSSTLNDDRSEGTTHGIVTPTSSRSETLMDNDATDFAVSMSSGRSSTQVRASSPAEVLKEPPKEEVKRSFTSFDQLIPNQPPTALLAKPLPVEKPPPLTLHNSKMSIFDDAMPGDKTTIKNKPTGEYLIQIEPASHHHSGWMTARAYTDFETLHEVVRRIAAITGSTGFTEAHSVLPSWKGHTKASLRGELERYLNDAVQFSPLAESEGMKRFLEKEMGSGKSPGGKGLPGIGWPGQAFESMGKGMIDVLTKAPKEVAGGGKALFGGVTGVLGSVTTPLGGGKKNRDSTSNSPASLSRVVTTPTPSIQNRQGRAESTVSELPTHIRTESIMAPATKRTSSESLRSPVVDQQPQREAPMERRPSYNPDGDGKRSGRSSVYGTSRSNSRAPSRRESIDLSPVMGGDQILNLPPIPSEIPDDYAGSPSRTSLDPFHSHQPSRASTTSLALSTDQVPPLPRRPSATSLTSPNSAPAPQKQPAPGPTPTAAIIAPTLTPPSKPPPKTYSPLSESETTVLIELFFAVIQELYTLSSAWNIRRTLLNAAKTFLLRPGNPQLASIQALLQTTVLDANTSDSGVAHQLRKIRENSMPTEAELAQWPAEMSDEEKDRLRVRARKLLVERGMPQALTSVMGQAASGEALGRVFDVLQDARVARGVMFGLVLQGLRAVTQ
ncbi:PXA domain-containing protein [Massariosphaeria phaeospora]|uniref:PXA domain-containing protein n=1 Tax=Massariosphaeria phaeospora TaxID=100035 RepID=A0A7C8MGL7_9PLEO|nr:PXA domain-containing protein [Massariosphaeria phaeospora]